MHLTGTLFLFWVAGFVAHVVLLMILLAHRHAKTFPIFTTLIAANVLNSVVLYVIRLHDSKHSYFIAYFAFAILDLLLQLSVTYELASRVFCATGSWAPDVRKGFLLLVLASVAIAFALACLPSPLETTTLGKLLDRGNLFSSALQCELFVGMIAFSSTAGLPWNTHVARIAQGLGFYSLVGLLTEAGHNFLSQDAPLYDALTYLRMSTYLVCASYWIVMLWLPAPCFAGITRRGQKTTLYFTKACGIRSSQAPVPQMMITIRSLYFFSALLIFLTAILVVGAYYYLRNRRREVYPYGQWEELLKRLEPLDHRGIGLIAGEPAAELDQQTDNVATMDPEDIWRLLGGMRGIEVMEKNCSVLVDLVFYVQQWYPEALLIAEQLRLNAREVEWHVGRLRAASKSGRPPSAAAEYLQQAVSTYYRMTCEVVALYEQANLPGLADLQRAM
ncbi:MAG: hypothetical protein M3Y72_26680 [Acidobacteriota bacterium]|nr:hypothetical protein [Acidobacteriota bacterium]